MRFLRCLNLLPLVFVAACGGEGSRGTGAEGPGRPGDRAAGARTPKVLVIGIDGVRPDILAEVATPSLDALAELVAAIRSRPTYAAEDWLILSSTDHGRRADGGHGGDTPEERTIYYLVSGPGAVRGSLEGPIGVVDVAVTALAHLGIPADPAWELDGAVVGLVEPRNR